MENQTQTQAMARNSQIGYRRLFLPAIIFALLSVPSLREIIIGSLADAFLQVSIFVAATLAVYYFLLERFPQLELAYVRTHFPHFETPLAAFLGALPGCGGAIIVVTQFTKGQASFGSVVAVLTATMGDAAFLLLATKPVDGLIILSMGLIVGIVSGSLVNAIHKPDYLMPRHTALDTDCLNKSTHLTNHIGRLFWIAIAIPGLIISLLLTTQFDFEHWVAGSEIAINYLGAACALIVLLLWAFSSQGDNYQDVTSEDKTAKPYSKLNKIMQDTHFVTAWVIAAFVLYEVMVAQLGLDLKAWFAHYAVLAPLVGVLIGLLPGCGPQILVTTLYINGIVPFSAVAANAISNDGDALFPAIALAPKAAIVATLYSAIPALLVGYGIYWLS